MNLQARLTLYYVLLAVVMLGFISAVDLANDIQLQFDLTLERAESLRALTADMVELALNRQRTTPLDEVVRDPELAQLLRDTMLASHAILEIAVVNPEGVVLADSVPDHVGEALQRYEDFRPVVTRTNWYQKLGRLRDLHYYQLLDQPLGAPGGPPLVYVRVIIDPALIRADVVPRLRESALAASLLVGGAVALTLLFSAFAFRPVGRLRKQLDLLASGEYEEPPAALKPARDDFSIMASKVSLLGERLRGAQFEVSDLRGNIDRLLQDLEDAVFLFNRESRLVFASGSVEKLLGRERDSLVGQAMATVFPPETKAGLLIAQAAETGRALRNRRAEAGNAKVLLSVDVLERAPGGGSGVLVRLRDPEAQRQIGHELRMADRLSALSRVSGGVAHEVKNPLNAILLHVEVARAKVAQGDTEIEPQMEIIAREILRLDRVVKTFLDFTRPVELKLSDVPLEELVGEIAELARLQADSQQIRLTVTAAAGVVRVDRDLLKQALLNIVVNAVEAMPGGGELRLESSVRGPVAEIRVADTGPGISPELRDKIFKLYFTTKKEGSGIGLAMTFRIVQLHDGTIDFTSEPGSGTTFVIQLPLVEQEASDAEWAGNSGVDGLALS